MGKRCTPLAVVVFWTAVGIVSGVCSPGTKNNPSASSTKCMVSSTDCNGACCLQDTTKCLGDTNLNCGADKYRDPSKNGVDISATGTTAAQKVAACCTAFLTCAAATCPAGMEKKSTGMPTYCEQHSCEICCQPKSDICYTAYMANNAFCGSDKYFENSMAAAMKVGNTAAACCYDMSTCGAATCSAGMIKKSSAGIAATKCSPTKTFTTPNLQCSKDICCVADTTKCEHATVDCGSDHFRDTTKNAITAGSTDTEKKANCCTAKKTCTVYWAEVQDVSGAKALMPAIGAGVLVLAAGVLG